MRFFGLGLFTGGRRGLETAAAAPEPAPPEPEPQPTPSPQWYRTGADLDLPALANAAATRFEQIYYRHAGRRIMKWRQYLPLYDRLLTPFVGKPVTVLEIGLAAGGSIELWRAFLGPQTRIIGIDVDPACRAYASENVEVMIGSQSDRSFLEEVAKRVGPLDIVIDDGSHVCSDQITSMEVLFPRLRPGGLYVCEDLHTSYWDDYGGGWKRTGSYIEYVKDLIDRLHHDYFGLELAPDDLARSVEWLTVADSIAAFGKGAPSQNYMVEVGK